MLLTNNPAQFRYLNTVQHDFYNSVVTKKT